MYQYRRQSELCQKRQQRHRQKEHSGSYSEERKYHEQEQKLTQHPVENKNCSCNVSDDETYHSNPSNARAKAKSKASSTSDGELRRDPWSGQSHNELSVTVDKLVEATNHRGERTLMMPLPGLERAVSEPTHMPLSLPKDIRHREHSL